jgi:hypothetical protein
MEWLGFLRTVIWQNAGFGALRKIRFHIEDYEPRYEPTVVPLASAPHEASSEEPVPPSEPVTPQRYYSTDDYHRMYLSGELTPIAVARALLPLIRKDTLPPGEHSTAWYDTKAEQVLLAAEASTERYAEKRPLGPLDGVPTAVKDEFEIHGYSTCLGSRNDYTADAADGEISTSWCVQKLEEAGALVLGKLNMHEFGLGT